MDFEEHEEENHFIRETISPDGRWLIVFEDDGHTGYMYLCMLEDGEMKGIVDALWIYDQIDPPITERGEILLGWAHDTMRVMLMIGCDCWGIIDIGNQRKLTAPRDGNQIRPILDYYIENGLGSEDGELLRLTLD